MNTIHPFQSLRGRSFRTHGIIGRQYGSRSSANRAIRRYEARNFATIPKGFQFWANQLDWGCYEVGGACT
jgi:hypothetical protein